MNGSSRKLSVYEYFQILQVEWIVADLRARIYPQEIDKNHWNKVKEGKKRVIDNIAEKNMIPTIFSDEEMKRALETLVYKEKGIPNFHYKDDECKTTQQPLDLAYYYTQGVDVRFEQFGELKIGKIKSYTPNVSKDILIELADGARHKVPIEEVTRII